MKKILILGGYGNFGKRIVEGLLALPNITIIIAGRDSGKADLLVEQLKDTATANLKAMQIDIYAYNFESTLKDLSPDIVIHTSGPFQGQTHCIPVACINAGAHYIDLADDRQFVSNITNLHSEAKAKDILIVSGASTVPGLSSTVIDFYQHHFSAIHNIDIAIAPGNQAERGEATIKGILSYTGHAFNTFKNSEWGQSYGWMDPRTLDFGGIIGKRWLANVDVPDLVLFPERYAVKDSVRFQAGLELPFLHLTLVGMGYIAKLGLIKSWASLSKPIVKMSDLFKSFGSNIGGMQIHIQGEGKNNQKKDIIWTLYAPDGIGPYIPTLPTIIIAKKLISGELTERGATPCLGLFSLPEFTPVAKALNIDTQEQVLG